MRSCPVDSIELQLHLLAVLFKSAAPSGATRLEKANNNQINPPRPVNTSGKVLSGCTKRMDGLLAMLDSNSENSDSESRRRSISPCRDETATLANACIWTLSTDLASNEELQLTSSGTTTCRWKDCKKVDKTNEGCAFQICSRTGCDREAHVACVAAMLDAFGAGATFNSAASSKRCYNTLVNLSKKAAVAPPTGKKRVMWHNDGPSDDLSSLSVLIDWISYGDNYDRYRGGEVQNGETKVALAEQMSRLIPSKELRQCALQKTSRARSHRLSHHIEPRWIGLQRLAKVSKTNQPCASAFLRGVVNVGFRKEDTESEGASSSDDSTGEIEEKTKQTNAAPERSASIPISIGRPQSKRIRKDDLSSQPAFGRPKEAQLAQQRDQQHAELDLRKQEICLREKEFDARGKQLENEARLANAQIEESNAQAMKLKEEHSPVMRMLRWSISNRE
ncbi:unnamed protein product [Phytophthora fragariaefolia]|uniref:Unnamed protein product n=1 Tax=Phytophthora fragariaefolia TaxID=1490495 RepID=A0A9W6XI13_9STRA|nr:unnamed protein product [Phytophthora fragariaefolia]